MNDFPRQKLKELIASNGPALSDDPLRCRDLLLTTCSAYQFEVNVLIAALQEHVASELMRGASNTAYPLLQARLVNDLQTKQKYTTDVARWAVDSWALALGIIQSVPGGSDVAGSQGPSYGASGNPVPAQGATLHDAATDTTVISTNPPSSPVSAAAGGSQQSVVRTDPYASMTPPPPPDYRGPTLDSYPPIPPHSPYSERSDRPRRTPFIVGSIIALLVIVGTIAAFALLNHPAPVAVVRPPTATPVPYPAISTAYLGTVRNTTGNLNANFSLSSVSQDKGNLSGDLTVGLPLVGSGLFTGTVTRSGLLHMVATSNDGSNITITYVGSLASDGSASGTYSVSNNQGGSWSMKAKKTPDVYPILYAKYSGTFYNNANSKTGAITLLPKTQDQQNFSGDFQTNGTTIAFTGTVGTDNSLQFSFTSSGTTIKFVGSDNTDGSLGGTFTSTAGGNGTWRVTPG